MLYVGIRCVAGSGFAVWFDFESDFTLIFLWCRPTLVDDGYEIFLMYLSEF